ncbi:MAG: mechanosensitive ion channel family protein [Clostridiales bacterium]|nr:mechanosensitive ion channel family protein [Clostridiales bacterium]
MTFFERSFYHNTLKNWLIGLGIAFIAFLILRLFKAVAHRKVKAFAERTTTSLDDLAAGLIDRTKYFFLILVAIYIGSLFLVLPGAVKLVVNKLMTIALLVQGALWGSTIFDHLVRRYQQRKKAEEDTASLMTFAALGFILRLVLWSIVAILALDNLGVQVTALVAGLGVGGIAIALAVQNILGDLFASMSIVLDKPFVIGDFIIVDNLTGTVEHIGLKTTRLRSLNGEQLVFANSDLLKSRIKNYQRMEERRVVFTMGVVYQTPAEKLAAIPHLIQDIIESQELARFDRSHFKEFGDFALVFESVYFLKTPDYGAYMDTQQAINLAIFNRFQKEGIEFAYPTQTIFVDREDGLPGLPRSKNNPPKRERFE